MRVIEYYSKLLYKFNNGIEYPELLGYNMFYLQLFAIAFLLIHFLIFKRFFLDRL